MEQINLHFTGDFHAITSAHSLAAALIDNHVYWANELNIDVRRIHWRRVVDMNDRALRADHPVARRRRQRLPAGGRLRHHGRLRGDGGVLPRARPRRPRGAPRPDRHRRDPRPQARDAQGREGHRRHDGAAEGRPAAEPRADARGQPGPDPRRPLRQHRPWLQLGDRHPRRPAARRLHRDRSRLRRRSRRGEVLGHQVPPGRAVALGGRHRRDGARPEDAWRRRQEGPRGARTSTPWRRASPTSPGTSTNVRGFGLPVVVAVNHFHADTDAEHAKLRDLCRDKLDVEAITCRHWAEGGAGAEDLARAVVELVAGRAEADRLRLRGRGQARRTRSRRSRPSSTARPTSRSSPRRRASSPPSRRTATATCRSAWPRRSTRSRPIPA